MNKAAFLDRDGVINVNKNRPISIATLNDWDFMPGAAEAVKLLREWGYKIIVVTNQAGIGRGEITEVGLHCLFEAVQEIDKRFKVDAWYYCPHTPEKNCPCRKPESGLFELACYELDIDPARSFMIGDQESDMQAAEAAGIKGFLFEDDMFLTEFLQCNRPFLPDNLS